MSCTSRFWMSDGEGQRIAQSHAETYTVGGANLGMQI